MKLKLSLVAAAMALTAGAAMAQTQGVSKTEITLGSIQDLSGPLAGFGKQARFGMQLAVAELNEQGGINGRKLKLLVEDNGYDPKKSVLAAQNHQPKARDSRPLTTPVGAQEVPGFHQAKCQRLVRPCSLQP